MASSINDGYIVSWDREVRVRVLAGFRRMSGRCAGTSASPKLNEWMRGILRRQDMLRLKREEELCSIASSA